MAEKFKFVKDLFGHRGAPIIAEFPVATAQTLLKGDLVFLSSGQVTIAGASTVSVLGIMAEDSAGAAAGTLVKVLVAAPGYVFNATADADATSHVLATKKYDINATTQTVDVGDNANGCIIILELADSTTNVNIMFTESDLGAVN
jgi:hypothetical protein